MACASESAPASPNIASWGPPPRHPALPKVFPATRFLARQRLLHFARRATTQLASCPANLLHFVPVATNVHGLLVSQRCLPFHTLHTCCAPFKRSQRKSFEPTNQLNLSFLQNGATLCPLVELLNRNLNLYNIFHICVQFVYLCSCKISLSLCL